MGQFWSIGCNQSGQAILTTMAEDNGLEKPESVQYTKVSTIREPSVLVTAGAQEVVPRAYYDLMMSVNTFTKETFAYKDIIVILKCRGKKLQGDDMDEEIRLRNNIWTRFGTFFLDDKVVVVSAMRCWVMKDLQFTVVRQKPWHLNNFWCPFIWEEEKRNVFGACINSRNLCFFHYPGEKKAKFRKDRARKNN